MKAWIRIAVLATLTVCGAMAGVATADDNMTPYRTMAGDALTAFKAHDMATARTRARDLEVAWDSREKALEKKYPEVWGQIDKAMDAFIKPMKDKSPDPVNVQAAYDAFIAKLKLAVTKS